MHSTGLILELSSIAKGYFTLDQCLKSAKVHIIEAAPISPGKFLMLFSGSPDDIKTAYDKALATSKSDLVDSAILPNLHTGILDALYGLSKVEAGSNGIVVVETSTLTGMLLALHSIASAKTAVRFIEVKPGRGLGGKSVGYFTGDIESLNQSADIFTRVTKQRGSFIDCQIIASPHVDFLSFFNITGG